MATLHVQAACPNCQRVLRVPKDYAGRRVGCRHCEQLFLVPDRLVIACPQCSRELKVKTEHLGKSASCKHCQHVFTIAPQMQLAPAPAVAAGVGATGTESLASLSVNESVTIPGDPANAMPGSDPGRDGALRELQQQLESVKAEFSKYQHLDQDYASLRREHETQRTQMQGFLDEITHLQKELQGFARVSQERDEERQAREVLENNYRETLTLLETIRSENRNRGEAPLGFDPAEFANTLQELESLRRNHDQLLQEYQSAQSQLDFAAASASVSAPDVPSPEAAAAIAELDVLRSERDRLDAELRTVWEEAQSLRSQAERAAHLERDFDEIRAERNRLQDEVQDLLANLETLRTETDRLDALKQERDLFFHERNKLSAELDISKSRFDELSQVLADGHISKEEFLTLQSERDKLRSELDDVCARWALLAEHAPPSDPSSASAPCELEALRTERERLDDQVRVLMQRLRVMETAAAQTGRLGLEFDVVCAERDRFVRELAESRDRVSHLWKDIEKLEIANAELEKVRTERDRLLSAQNNAAAQGGHAGNAKALAAVDAASESILERMRQEMDVLRKEREGALQQLNLFTQDRQNLITAREQSEAGRVAAERRYQQMVERGNQVFQKAQQHVETLTGRNQLLSDEVQRLRGELAQTQQQFQAQLQQMQNANANVGRRRMDTAPGVTTTAAMASQGGPGADRLSQMSAASGAVDLPMTMNGGRPAPRPGLSLGMGGGSAPAGANAGGSSSGGKSQREVIDEMRNDLERRLAKSSVKSDAKLRTQEGEEPGEEMVILHTDLALNQFGSMDDL